MMAKSPFNIQDQYLNQARKERVHVTILMMSGDNLQGYVKSFDSFCVLVDAGGDLLLYKHAISSITSTDGHFRLHGGRD
jgi:host factor-I protein